MEWLETVSRAQASGALAEAYTAMVEERPMPPVYRPAHGGAPDTLNVRRSKSGSRLCARMIPGALATTSLPWADRELLASVTSRTNQCFY
jgi:hypothetical protein